MSDEVAGWVWDTNVRKMMEYLSLWTAYDFGESDWQAIESSLPDTDADTPNGRYQYPLGGRPRLSVQVAANPGASPVGVRVRGDLDEVLSARIQTLSDVLADVRGA